VNRRQKKASVYGLRLNGDDEFELSWRDEEGDYVSLGSDIEWKEAVRSTSLPLRLRLLVTHQRDKRQQQEHSSASTTARAPPQVPHQQEQPRKKKNKKKKKVGP